MPTRPTPGRSLVTRRAIVDIVRTATLDSYGVTGFSGSPLERFLGRVGLTQSGIAVHLDDELDIELDLLVAFGVPVAEVARQVDSAVRYALRRALDREVRRLTIHVAGLRFGPGGDPPIVVHPPTDAIGPRDLADSGTDVA
ncbi:MAG TPA: Asp23/Gls24 family envelope stress response protein [Candidatus Limnocylindrales bacterium]|nr:Asp23/Gls24 family envelope stress response protein [Candidatus Limnocylindrales bacterium]